jgi:hypothetical protein
MRLLWEANADTARRSQKLASQHGRWEVMRPLCEAGARTDKTRPYGAAALRLASQRGHLEVRVCSVCQARADKDKAAPNGTTVFIIASQSRHLAVVRLLCEAGADAGKACADGASAFIIASQCGHLEAVRLLCEAGADTGIARPGCATAFMLAPDRRHLEVMRLLLRPVPSRAGRDHWHHSRHACVSARRPRGEFLLCEAGAGMHHRRARMHGRRPRKVLHAGRELQRVPHGQVRRQVGRERKRRLPGGQMLSLCRRGRRARMPAGAPGCSPPKRVPAPPPFATRASWASSAAGGVFRSGHPMLSSSHSLLLS